MPPTIATRTSDRIQGTWFSLISHTLGHMKTKQPRSGNAIPQVQVPAALQNHHHTGLVERTGTQVE